MTRDRDLTGSTPTEGDGAARRAAAMADFTAYWQGMRRGADVPRRSDIDPRGIEPLLPNAFVAERIAPGLARIRIAGSHLTDLMGMEVRGMPISAFIIPAHRDALSHHLVRLFDEPATLRLTLAASNGHGARGPGGTMLVLPLRSDLGDISRALGCLVTEGMPGPTPCRFTIAKAQITPLPPPAPSRVPAQTAPRILPEASQAEAPNPHRAERPHLRLVKG